MTCFYISVKHEKELRGICNCQRALDFKYSACVIDHSQFNPVAGHSCALSLLSHRM